MKTVGLIVLCALAVLSLICGGLYLFTIRPARVFIEDNKPKLVEVANSFMACILEQPPEDCRQTLMTEECKAATPAESLKLVAEKMKSNLGHRASASPIDKSFTWRKFFDSKGESFSIAFVMNVPYEHDAHASEYWTLVRQGDGPFLVQQFRINSNEMLK